MNKTKQDRLREVSAGFNEAIGDTQKANQQRGNFRVLRPSSDLDITPPRPDPELEAERQMQLDAHNAAMEAQEMRRNMTPEQAMTEEEMTKLRNLEALKKLKEAQMRGEIPEHLKALIKK